jgi:hypothetical protein
LGPLSSVTADAADLFEGTFDPQKYFPDAKLLGALPYPSFCGRSRSLGQSRSQVSPSRATRRDCIGKTDALQNLGPFRPEADGKGATLELDLRLRAATGGISSQRTTLTNFTFDFFEVIELEFARVSF